MSTATRPSRASRTWARRTWTYLYGHWELYLFLLPGLVFAMMFKLLPMSKIVIAFKNFKPLKGIAASPWVGFAQFEKMFADPDVLNVIKNTLEINLMIVIFVVPLPMLLAIMLNEITFMPLKKGIQTLIYIPHFFTWVVVYSVFFVLFGKPAAGVFEPRDVQFVFGVFGDDEPDGPVFKESADSAGLSRRAVDGEAAYGGSGLFVDEQAQGDAGKEQARLFAVLVAEVLRYVFQYTAFFVYVVECSECHICFTFVM